MQNIESIESAIVHSQKMLDDINNAVLQHAKKINALIKRDMAIIKMVNEGGVEPLN